MDMERHMLIYFIHIHDDEYITKNKWDSYFRNYHWKRFMNDQPYKGFQKIPPYTNSDYSSLEFV